MDYEMIVWGLIVLLVILVITNFGYLVFKVLTDEKTRKHYEEIIYKKNGEINELFLERDKLMDKLANEHEFYLKDKNESNRLINKLIVDIAFYEEVDKRKQMTPEEEKTRKKTVNKTVKDGKKHLTNSYKESLPIVPGK